MWGIRFVRDEFLFVPHCDCNLLRKDLMAKVGIKIGIVKNGTESNTLITSCKMSEKYLC